ncbi:hypothetical protein L6452_15101 [Arctium lappa]|uniref:Uncharacterized protein n=1 Tax=Arctium lappa TaxID=4217 RepID=A0ACB9CMT3_ARCLA|nr:hypothetical protein L6452_15101 [Arctium lappa]
MMDTGSRPLIISMSALDFLAIDLVTLTVAKRLETLILQSERCPSNDNEEANEDDVVNDEELKKKLLEDQQRMLTEIIRMMFFALNGKRKRKAVDDEKSVEKKKKSRFEGRIGNFGDVLSRPNDRLFYDTTYGRKYMRYKDLPFIPKYHLEALIPVINI